MFRYRKGLILPLKLWKLRNNPHWKTSKHSRVNKYLSLLVNAQCHKKFLMTDIVFTSAAETNGGSACARGVAEEEEVMLGAELYTDIDCENKCHSHFHDTVGQSDEQHHHHHDYHHILHHHHSQNHHPHTHTHRHTQSYSLQHFQQAGVATLAWMVIMGDGLHNFSDGLAIGK